MTSVGLPAGVRVGLRLGSVATGAFGTVPGLLLLPYLTDTLGITAGVAGLVVFVPKAWDVLLNPVAGRISDRSSAARAAPAVPAQGRDRPRGSPSRCCSPGLAAARGLAAA